jgi:hypothetical protein
LVCFRHNERTMTPCVVILTTKQSRFDEFEPIFNTKVTCAQVPASTSKSCLLAWNEFLLLGLDSAGAQPSVQEYL